MKDLQEWEKDLLAYAENVAPQEDKELICYSCGGHDGHFDSCTTLWIKGSDYTDDEIDNGWGRMELDGALDDGRE